MYYNEHKKIHTSMHIYTYAKDSVADALYDSALILESSCFARRGAISDSQSVISVGLIDGMLPKLCLARRTLTNLSLCLGK